MYEVLRTILTEDLRLTAEGIQPDVTCEDAGLDSLAIVELSMVLSARLRIEISDEELLHLHTVGDIVALMEERSVRA